MNKRTNYLFILMLLLASAVFYCLDHWLFQRGQDLAFYSLLDLAFLPIQVLLLYFVINRLLAEQERRNRRHKLNMVIGTFFSAVGRPLLSLLTDMVVEREPVAAHLAVDPEWDKARLREAQQWVKSKQFVLRATPEQLAPLKRFLIEEREFMVRLLENPALLEHEQFTDLLWAISHLEEELSARESLENLPAADLAHLCGDSERAYGRVLGEWLEYMIHLKRFYPYLFSFAARTNPLREGAKAEIE
jgi:hypothetical protein